MAQIERERGSRGRRRRVVGGSRSGSTQRLNPSPGTHTAATLHTHTHTRTHAKAVSARSNTLSLLATGGRRQQHFLCGIESRRLPAAAGREKPANERSTHISVSVALAAGVRPFLHCLSGAEGRQCRTVSSTRAAPRCDTGPLCRSPRGAARPLQVSHKQPTMRDCLQVQCVCVCLSEGGGTAEARHIQASSPFVCSNVRRRQGHSPRHATTSGPPHPKGSLGEWRGPLRFIGQLSLSGHRPGSG